MGRYGPHGITTKRWQQQKMAGFKLGNKAGSSSGSGSVCRKPVPVTPPSPAVTRQRAKELERESEGNEYQVCQLKAIETLWNNAIRDHSKLFPQCTMPDLKQFTTEQRMLSKTASLHCTKCGFMSTAEKLYTEQQKSGPGRKPSTLNLATGAALIKSPIGATVFREVTMTMGLDPGSYNGLQKNINKANDMMVEIGEANRASIREKLRASGKPLRVSGDARYCSPQSSSTSGPFEGASQSTFNLTEETTGKVIGLHNQNKLCTKATRLRHSGHQVICPDHEGPCTATLLPSDSIGNEGRSLRKIVGNLKNDGIEISHFTSDGDASMKKALKETCEKAVWLRDSHHFQEAHILHLKKITFSDTMFGHEKTKQWRQNAKHWFCLDVGKRCSAELTAAVNVVTAKTKDDLEIKKELNSMLIDTTTAIINCYKNDCTHCQQHSLVCSGEDDGFRWQAANMTEASRRNLNMTEQDEEKLRLGILVRLGQDAIEKTFLNTNSQKNEAVNRTISKCLPKSVTFPRNLEGRANAAVTTVNEGQGGLTVLCLRKIGHRVSGTVERKLNKDDMKRQVRADYRKRPEVKKTTCCRQGRKICIL